MSRHIAADGAYEPKTSEQPAELGPLLAGSYEAAGQGRFLLDDPALAQVLEASVNAVIVLNHELKVRWANPNTEQLLGISLRQLTVTDPLTLVHPEDLDEAAHLLGRMSGGIEDDPPAVIRLLRGDGTYVWVEVMGSDLTHVPGIDGVMLAVRDITHRMTLEEQLRASGRRFEALVRNSNDAIIVLGPDLTVIYSSPSIEVLIGYAPANLVGEVATDIVMEPERAELEELFASVVDGRNSHGEHRIRVRHISGELRWLEVRFSNQLADPTIKGVIANISDVTDVVSAENEAARLTEIFELTDDLVAVIDDDSRLLYMNPACCEFMGLDPNNPPYGMAGVIPRIEPPESPDSAFSDGQDSLTSELVLRRHDGERMPFSLRVIAHRDDAGVISRYSTVARDVSESKALADSLKEQALHDPLTGLPNRAMLERRAAELSAFADRGLRVAMLFVDLDHFKVINDSLGHEFGDRILQEVAQCMKRVVRPADMVVRFGGDEFIVLSEGMSPENAVRLADRIAESIGSVVSVDGVPIHIGVSIGIRCATVEQIGADPAALVRDADTAMYRAKENGRATTVVFDDSLRRRAIERQSTETMLRRATYDGTLELHYQPIVDMATGRLVSIEALVRWYQNGRMMPPDSFIPIAEETGLMPPIGTWVLNTACADLARWRCIPGWADLRVSVNVSARQLQTPDFVEVVLGTLAKHGLSGDALVLEITESVLVDDRSVDMTYFERLASSGISWAIDDFGTGYSSLTYFSRLPIDIVKLDRTFLRDAMSNAGHSRLVAGVLQLVQTVGLHCVAEGVESEAQFELLAELGSECGQGFHIARPMTQEDMHQRLLSLNSSKAWPRGVLMTA